MAADDSGSGWNGLAVCGVVTLGCGAYVGMASMRTAFYAVTASPIGEPAPVETSAALGAFLAWCQGAGAMAGGKSRLCVR